MARGLLRSLGRGAPFALVGGCNLVLGVEATPGPDPGVVEACTIDSDCHAPSACYTGTCDSVLHVCHYALCPAGPTCQQATCSTGNSCDTAAASPSLVHGLIATSIPLGEDALGCQLKIERCLAAAYPFAFVGTGRGVRALQVDELRTTSPRQVRIDGLEDLHVALIVASGQYVYVLGELSGAAPPYKLDVAVITVPANPRVPSLTAQRVTLDYQFNAINAFPAPDGALFVVADQQPTRPAAILRAPLRGGSLAPAAVGSATQPAYTMYETQNVPGEARLVGASGDRLVLHVPPASFALIEKAATPTTAVTKTTPARQGELILAPSFATGPDGSFLWSFAKYDPSQCDCVTQTQLSWLYGDGTAALPTTDPPLELDSGTVGRINQDASSCRNCVPGIYRSRVAWLDRDVAVALSQRPREGKVRTRVQVMDRHGPLGRMQELDPASQELSTNFMALVGSQRFGYLLISDPAGNDLSLSIIDPDCSAL